MAIEISTGAEDTGKADYVVVLGAYMASGYPILGP